MLCGTKAYFGWHAQHLNYVPCLRRNCMGESTNRETPEKICGRVFPSRKKAFLFEKSMKPELCAVRVFFFQITAAFHFSPFALHLRYVPITISACSLSARAARERMADESSSLSSASRKRRYFPVASFIPAFLAAPLPLLF